MTPSDVASMTKYQLTPPPHSPLVRDVNRLRGDIATWSQGWRRLIGSRRREVKIAKAIETFDCHLALTAYPLTYAAVRRVADRRGWRNEYHPQAIDHLDDIVAAITPAQIAPFLTGWVYNHVVMEQSRREALARVKIAKVDLGGDVYMLKLTPPAGPGKGSYLEYEVAPGATTGFTRSVHVEAELQGLGVGTRLYETMAERHAYVQQWRPAGMLKPAGAALRRHLHAKDPVLWP